MKHIFKPVSGSSSRSRPFCSYGFYGLRQECSSKTWSRRSLTGLMGLTRAGDDLVSTSCSTDR
jgi:hypothetical protein